MQLDFMRALAVCQLGVVVAIADSCKRHSMDSTVSVRFSAFALDQTHLAMQPV